VGLSKIPRIVDALQEECRCKNDWLTK
jgi:hypothetical protein